jgi:hypothetical protein
MVLTKQQGVYTIKDVLKVEGKTEIISAEQYKVMISRRGTGKDRQDWIAIYDVDSKSFVSEWRKW